MPTSIRFEIRDRAILELNTDRPVDVPLVTNRRWVPGESDVMPSMAVVFLDEEPQPTPSRAFPLVRRALVLGVECVVSAEDPGQCDDLLEPLLKWAVAVLGETNLNGYALNVEESRTSWQIAQMDRNYLRGTARFIIEYQTRRNDLTLIQ